MGGTGKLMGGETFEAPIEFLADERIHGRVVTDGLLNARRLIRIATANVKDIHIGTGPKRRFESLLKPLAKFVKSGGELHILHGGIPSRRFLGSLEKYGFKEFGRFRMKRCPRVHLKAVLVDGDFVFLGSPNFTGAGLGAKSPRKRNFEIGVASRDARLYDLVEARYDWIWSGGGCGVCRLKKMCCVPLEEPWSDEETGVKPNSIDES